jgi:hypothetical protein
MRSMNGLNYFGVALLGLGGIFGLWTLRAIARRRALLQNPVRVKGEVVRVRHVAPSAGDTGTNSPGKYYATARYKSYDGSVIERELPATSDSSDCEVGALVRLVYQRGDPANVIYADMRWKDLVFGAFGALIVLVIGALLCFCVDAAPGEPGSK